MTDGAHAADTPDVTAVVVTYQSVEVIGGLLDSLEQGCAGVTARLVVVDNGSSDGTVEAVRAKAPHAVVLDTRCNLGYAAGLNKGVATLPAARGYLLLNPDVRLQEGCVRRLLAAMERTGAGMVVPRLDDAKGCLIASQRREPTIVRALADLFLGAERAGRLGRLGEVVTDRDAYDREQDTDWAEGSVQLVSAACWSEVGPWDESFFLYSEETEFALRAGDAGWRCRYVPDARAVHLEGGSAHTPLLWRLLVANRWRLYARRHGRVAGAAFWCVLVAREGSRSLLGRATSRAALGGLLDRTFLRSRPGPETVRAV